MGEDSTKPLRAAVLIPALNEEACLAATLHSIPPGLFQWIIVADNGSADRTAEIARQCGALVVHEPERGYGAACQRGLEALPEAAEAVVFLQADSSEDPQNAADLLRALSDGRNDLVIGSRTLGAAEPGALLPHQVFGNWLATRLIRLLYGYRYTDLGPFRAIRLDALRRLGMRDRNYGWTIEMQVKALELGLRVVEIPVPYRRRLAGQNKVSGNWRASLAAGWTILWTVFRLALTRPFR